MKFQDKHLQPATAWRGEGYLDTSQIDRSQSYALMSKPNMYGCRLAYQKVVMNDGTIYNLRSQTASTRGIVADIIATGLLQREVKRHYSDDTIYY